MSKRFFCVKDCWFNKNYFYGRRFYDEYELSRGLADGTKPSVWEDRSQGQPRGQGIKRPGNKYMIQIAPRSKDRTDQQEKLLDVCVEEMETEIRSLREYSKGGQARGVGKRIEGLEKIIRELAELRSA